MKFTLPLRRREGFSSHQIHPRRNSSVIHFFYHHCSPLGLVDWDIDEWIPDGEVQSSVA